MTPTATADPYAAAERRSAARALLRHPLLVAGGQYDEEFRLVRRHREELTRLFADALGYRLVVEPRVSRLFKAGLGRDPSRPLRRRTGAAFTPRGYALLCLTLAALTQAKGQLLIEELVGEVRSVAADAGIDVDLDRVADRRALHGALTTLADLGVLRERDSEGGGLAKWAESSHARSLLDVVRDRLRLLIAAPVSAAAAPDELLDVAALPSAAGGARVAVRRRLVESPVLSITDLDGDQAGWWQKNRNREQDRLRELFGLEVELRAEGAAAIDPDDDLSDIGFPGVGTTKRFGLLVVERLAARCRAAATDAEVAERVWRRISADSVDAIFDDVVSAYHSALTKEYRSDPVALRRDVLAVLGDLGLVRIDADHTVWVHAAAARYAARPELAASAPTGEASLFGEEER